MPRWTLRSIPRADTGLTAFTPPDLAGAQHGSHDELVGAGGWYAELCELQARACRRRGQ